MELLTDKNASLDATDAVGFLLDTFTSSSHLEGRARFLNSNMAADNRDFLAELAALSEVRDALGFETSIYHSK